jgi:hypothetical protein
MAMGFSPLGPCGSEMLNFRFEFGANASAERPAPPHGCAPKHDSKSMQHAQYNTKKEKMFKK